MRILTLVSLLLLLAGTSAAQSSISAADAPDVIVTHAGWHKDVYIPGLLDDPMQANQQHADLERDQKILMKENKNRARSGQTQLPPLASKISSNPNDPGRSVNYIYEAKVKNTGQKTIRMISWVYSFIDPATESEVSQRRFTSTVDIRPGKSANVAGISTTPPIRVVHASKSSKETRDKYAERVTLDRIEYADGSFWQRPELGVSNTKP